MWKKRLFLSLILLLPIAIIAEPTYQLFKLPGRLRFDYQQVSMPNNTPASGMLGVHYDAFANSWLYGGLGVYSTINGRQGGFMAYGLEGGISHTLFGPIVGDAGLMAGAGGGGDASVGSGLFIQPYVGVAYNFNPGAVGLAYHYLKFVNGGIKSHALDIYFDWPIDLHYAYSGYNGTDIDHTINDNFVGEQPYASRDFLGLVFNNYFPTNGTKNTSGQNSTKSINMVGASYGHHFVNYDGFFFAQTDGAYRGTTGGYKDLLWGLGWSFALIPDYVQLQPKFAIGSGGGGDVDTGGGLLLNPSIALQFLLSKHFAFELDGGYIRAPQGSFQAVNASASLVYLMDLGSFNIISNNSALNSAYFQGWKLRFGSTTYFDAKRNTGNSRTLSLFTTDLNFMLGRYAYLAGQVGMSYAGQAGGFKTALAGFGLTMATPVGLYGQVLIGAGGGGGINTKEGLIVTPEIGLYAHITRLWSIYGAYGRVRALSGSHRLKSNTMNLGVSYRFSTLMGWK